VIIITREALRATLNRVHFGPSLDWDWSTEIESVMGGGWRFRWSFKRPDRDCGNVGRGAGRWWIVEPEATLDSVVKTAFAAAKMVVEDELMEAFHFDCARPFDPHRSVEDLVR
jgi:hypothetical protein